MSIKATILAAKTSVLHCRVYDPATGRWWTGSTWSLTEGDALHYTLAPTALADSTNDRYSATLTPPDGDYLLEYVDDATSEVIGEEPTQSFQYVITHLPSTMGTGDTAVNHDTPTAGNMTVVDQYAVGIANCNVVAFLTSDFTARNTSQNFVRGRSTTGIDGKWLTPMMLQSGLAYTILFYINGYLSSTKEITL